MGTFKIEENTGLLCLLVLSVIVHIFWTNDDYDRYLFLFVHFGYKTRPDVIYVMKR